MRGLTIIFALVLTDIAILPAQSVNARSAPAQAATCTACHGEGGHSLNDLWPNLAGQKKQYLVLQLHAFQSGQRVNPLMSPVAKMLSEQEINDLADYFSSLEAR